jgi:decaprenyl-phosphate phosphoribosyltransferase
MTSTRGPLRAMVSALRPAQWVKNLVVIVAPAAAGIMTHHDVAVQTLVAFVSFSLLASSLYIVNDLADRDADRAHPTKRFRAIASGDLAPRVAVGASLALGAGAFLVPLLIHSPGPLEWTLATYAVLTLLYNVRLKAVPVIEFAVVASGFFLRALAGAAASHLRVSEWFLVVISFGALFLVVGKRAAEIDTPSADRTRPVLAEYTPRFLESTLTLAASVAVTGYGLWAFDTSSSGLSSTHNDSFPVHLSVIPVVLAVLYILRGALAGEGETPEHLILHNRVVQSLGLIWAALLAWAVYR